jgi:hypothetical protein
MCSNCDMEPMPFFYKQSYIAVLKQQKPIAIWKNY